MNFPINKLKTVRSAMQLISKFRCNLTNNPKLAILIAGKFKRNIIETCLQSKVKIIIRILYKVVDLLLRKIIS